MSGKLKQSLIDLILPFVLLVFIVILSGIGRGKEPLIDKAIKANQVFVTNYITITNLAFVNPDLKLKYKCPVYTNKWHEITENCLDYKK